MNWFLIALIAPACWSMSNTLDKYLLSRYVHESKIGSLFIINSLLNIFLIPVILLFHFNVFDINYFSALLIFLNGFLGMLWILPYFYAMNLDDATVVISIVQIHPVFSFILGYLFLGEVLNPLQLIAALLIILGAFGMSLNLSDLLRPKFKKKAFFLMALAALLLSLNGFIFKLVTVEMGSFWTMTFWENLGLIACGLLFALNKRYRLGVSELLHQHKLPILAFNGLDKVFNFTAVVAIKFAAMLAPLAVVWSLDGLSPAFVFIYAVILKYLFPKYVSEKWGKREVIQKVIFILVIIFGSYLLNIATV